MRSLPLLLSILGLACCAKPPSAAPPPPPPDWLELRGELTVAELRNTPVELALPVFSPWKEQRPRLLLYPYPQVKRLTLPKDGIVRDVAFFDVGGRVLDLYSGAACDPGAASCVPLASRFPAMSVLIAPHGTIARYQLAHASQMRWIDGQKTMSNPHPGKRS